MSIGKKLAILAVVLIVLDQVVKIWIKTHMMIGEEFNVFGEWFKILFIENNGMAFGMELSSAKWGKLALSLFRIVAICAIGYYIHKLVKEKAPKGVLISFIMILCGALGNIIDSLFYGILFNHSHGQVATLLPEGGGYASLFYGKVVDMLYFPLIQGYLPNWLPIWGGEHFMFFRPVFNIADSYITIGVFILILFYRNYFSEKEIKKKITQEA